MCTARTFSLPRIIIGIGTTHHNKVSLRIAEKTMRIFIVIAADIGCIQPL